jgi:hypothetical protein
MTEKTYKQLSSIGYSFIYGGLFLGLVYAAFV